MRPVLQPAVDKNKELEKDPVTIIQDILTFNFIKNVHCSNKELDTVIAGSLGIIEDKCVIDMM